MSDPNEDNDRPLSEDYDNEGETEAGEFVETNYPDD
jgi:hypothetical protein